MDNEKKPNLEEKRHVKPFEKYSYILTMCFFMMFLGMYNGFRQDYLNDILFLNKRYQQILEVVSLILINLIGFGTTNFIDNYQGKNGKGKFKRLGLLGAIPLSVIGILTFYPFKNANTPLILISLICIQTLYMVLQQFAGAKGNISMVITPNENERNSIISSLSFFMAIFASAAQVVVLVLGFLKKAGYINHSQVLLIGQLICSICYLFIVFLCLGTVKERIPSSTKKTKMFEGFFHVVKNKNFLWLTFSHQVRNIRYIGSTMGIFLAGALFGDKSKFILLGIPTAIGAFVGMLIVKAMLKKWDQIIIYYIFGILSLIFNGITFVIGMLYLSGIGGKFMIIPVIICLVSIGIQFGASNIIPNLFNADIANEIELQTNGKRLEQSVIFCNNLFNNISNIIKAIAYPWILLEVIKYIQGNDIQSPTTQKRILFFYTIFVGFFFALSLIPFMGYKLTKKRRQEIEKALIPIRERKKQEAEAAGITVEEA